MAWTEHLYVWTLSQTVSTYLLLITSKDLSPNRSGGYWMLPLGRFDTLFKRSIWRYSVESNSHQRKLNFLCWEAVWTRALRMAEEFECSKASISERTASLAALINRMLMLSFPHFRCYAMGCNFPNSSMLHGNVTWPKQFQLKSQRLFRTGQSAREASSCPTRQLSSKVCGWCGSWGRNSRLSVWPVLLVSFASLSLACRNSPW